MNYKCVRKRRDVVAKGEEKEEQEEGGWKEEKEMSLTM